jgi:hypothetical protein
MKGNIMKKFDHLESVIDAIADQYGDHVASKIWETNSGKMLRQYASMLGIDTETLDTLIEEVNTFGW